MNKQLQNRLRQVGFVVLTLAAVAVIDGGQMNKAEAGIRVHARFQMPRFPAFYDDAPRHARIHRPFIHRVTQRDRVIARRIARQTGYRRGVLLNLRSRGMSWHQIGRRLDIPRRIVRMAVHSGQHQRIREVRGPVRCGTRRR